MREFMHNEYVTWNEHRTCYNCGNFFIQFHFIQVKFLNSLQNFPLLVSVYWAG